MKDAFGGIVNIVLVAIFLVIVSGILGLVVNYTKAFRMKNVIISAIEEYEGADSCFDGSTATGCKDKIIQKAKDYGYSPTELRCPTGEYKKNFGLFCSLKNDSDSGKNYVYTIVTQVNIDIPIINRIAGLSIFQVHGDTRVIRK